jgi:hypothetical protein
MIGAQQRAQNRNATRDVDWNGTVCCVGARYLFCRCGLRVWGGRNINGDELSTQQEPTRILCLFMLLLSYAQCLSVYVLFSCTGICMLGIPGLQSQRNDEEHT